MSFRPFEGNKNPLPWLQKEALPDDAQEEDVQEPAAAPSPAWVESHRGQGELGNQFADDLIEEGEEESRADEEAFESVPTSADAPVADPIDAQDSTAQDLDQAQVQPPRADLPPAAENGASAAPAARASASTSTRLRLSDILREADAQRGSPPSAVRAGEPARTLSEPSAPEIAVNAERAPVRPQPVAQEDYPTLLERPRDGTTEPFLDMMPEAMADDVDQNFKELEALPKAQDPLASAGQAPYVAPPPSRERRFQTQTAGRVPWRIVSALALALALAGFIAALSGWILTAEDSAAEVNRRIAAELTEVDRYLATNQEAIAEAEPDEEGGIELPRYPLAITVSTDEAQLPASELREVILDDAAALAYRDGVEAYGADSGLFDDFSTPGLVRFGIGIMQESTHDAFLLLTILAGLVTVAAIACVFLTAAGARLTVFGSAIALGGGLALIGSLIMRFIFDRASSREDDSLASGLGDIATDVSFLFTRNSLVFLAVGLVILTGGFILERLDRQTSRGDARRREPAKI